MTIVPVLEVQARIAVITQGLPGRMSASGAGVGGVLGASALAGGTATSGSFAADLQRARARQAAAASTAPSAATAAGPASTVTGAQAVATAKEYLGVPYVWGGKDPANGLDCSGLTKLVYSRLGVDLPHGSGQQARSGSAVPSLAAARPGDLLFFGQPTNHVGIYAGDGKMVHAPRTGKAVEVSSVYETPTDIRRVLPAASPAVGHGVTPPAAPRALAAFGGALASGTPYAAEFRKAEAATGVPARVLAAVAKTESGFRPGAVSSAGARGLMQFMPATARELGVDPMNPASAIDGAARLLKRHFNEFGSLELALAAYNAGQGSVRKYAGIPPYAETRQYVQKVLTILGSNS